MKYVVLACEALTDDPLEPFGNRTPLELAKAPFLQQLAKKGRVGSATFTSHRLALSGDVATMAILGYDPEEFYTGIAPLEALGAGIPQNDQEIAFRCDLVTVADDLLVDVSASSISPTESALLIEALNKKLSSSEVTFCPGQGYKNLLMIRDPEKAECLDALECVPPSRAIGQKFEKFLPKGDGASMIIELMSKARQVLEGHEINRVRIDLQENPANMIWPWGQGRRPKMPTFQDRFHVKGAVVSKSDCVQGLGLALGLEVAADLEGAILGKEFVFAYTPASSIPAEADPMKSKIRLIEFFDAQVVGHAIKALEKAGDYRILVCTDYATSHSKKSAIHGPVPFLIQGQGTTPEEGASFNERSMSQSRWQFHQGHQLMGHFLQ